ncbi:hypothetical protein GSI_06869 [Ganoderma sinense ZZ0214-1]|uniref:Uncharacterized protein n=1 Tax=Ganoderma sinense ZZ0214-1 TaxID=1077348 RepID=A0A2G8SAC0_9APHY|nr:hypothetical protein GSI_06869 [Ganoderma sinense ZZ0214-1]
MAAPNIAPNPHQVSQQQFANLPAQQQPNATIRDRMQQLLQRANQLRASGATVQNNEEFAKIWAIIQNMQQRQTPSTTLARQTGPSCRRPCTSSLSSAMNIVKLFVGSHSIGSGGAPYEEIYGSLGAVTFMGLRVVNWLQELWKRN